MNGKFLALVIFLTVSVLLAGCGEADLEGVILEVANNEVLVSRDLSPDEYERFKDVPLQEVQKEDVQGGGTSLQLIYLTYEDAEKFNKGDLVEVWLEGDVMASYPAQGKARKILLKE